MKDKSKKILLIILIFFIIPHTSTSADLIIPKKKPDIAKEISISLVFWIDLATEIVCLVITLCIFAELFLPISFDNLVLHLPKPCHLAIIISKALSNTFKSKYDNYMLIGKNKNFFFKFR